MRIDRLGMVQRESSFMCHMIPKNSALNEFRFELIVDLKQLHRNFDYRIEYSFSCMY